jgi:hypothetical protein
MTTKTRPVHELQLGNIKAAIWRHAVDGALRYEVTFSRFDNDGRIDSDSFRREDLRVLAKVSDMALNWICDQGSKVLIFPRRRLKRRICLRS